jgi:hypothetical protein
MLPKASAGANVKREYKAPKNVCEIVEMKHNEEN